MWAFVCLSGGEDGKEGTNTEQATTKTTSDLPDPMSKGELASLIPEGARAILITQACQVGPLSYSFGV